MSDFIWPSDANRAENDELNRVCEFLEETLDRLEDVLTDKGHLVGAIELLQQDVRRKMDERDAWQRMSEQYKREAYALAAHVERGKTIMAGLCGKDFTNREADQKLFGWYTDGPETSLARLETSLARLIAERQAEALDRLKQLLEETHASKAPTVSRVVMHVDDAINRVKAECMPLKLRHQAEENHDE
jgi:hypothetical protein